MASDKSLGGRNLCEFAMYMVIIALCIAALYWLLAHAHPAIAPKVKDMPASSWNAPPVIPSAFGITPRASA